MTIKLFQGATKEPYATPSGNIITLHPEGMLCYSGNTIVPVDEDDEILFHMLWEMQGDQ